MNSEILSDIDFEWVTRVKIATCYLRYLGKVSCPEKIINLLKDFINSGNYDLMKDIDVQFEQETLNYIRADFSLLDLNNLPLNTIFQIDILKDEYSDIQFLNTLSVEHLEKIHNKLEHLSDTLIQEYCDRIYKRQILCSGYDYKIVFDFIKNDYCDLSDFNDVISLFNILYEQEDKSLLPSLLCEQLNLFVKSNWGVLYNEYFELTKSFVELTSDYIQISEIIDTFERAFELLEKYYCKNKDNVSEYIPSLIVSWKQKIGDTCANQIQYLFEHEQQYFCVNDFEEWTDLILKFSPDNILALKIKIWCQSNTINDYSD